MIQENLISCVNLQHNYLKARRIAPQLAAREQTGKYSTYGLLKEKVCPNATLTIMKGLRHFCQLGSSEKWG